MPGDPAPLKGVPTIFTPADLLNVVAVKLPPFWPETNKTWIVQSESQFRLKGVTSSQTKFDYCVQSMRQEVTVKVLNLIRIPPPPCRSISTSQGQVASDVCSKQLGLR